jgi:hypothetical protein
MCGQRHRNDFSRTLRLWIAGVIVIELQHGTIFDFQIEPEIDRPEDLTVDPDHSRDDWLEGDVSQPALYSLLRKNWSCADHLNSSS